VSSAALWWTNQLKKKVPNSPQILQAFKEALENEMFLRFEGHWYEDDSQRGSAYRSVSFDNRLDSVLSRAARTVGIKTVEKLLSHTRYHIMFVNPGEVKVQNGTRLGPLPSFKLVYKKGSGKRSSKDSNGSSRPESPVSPNSPVDDLSDGGNPRHSRTNSLGSPPSPPQKRNVFVSIMHRVDNPDVCKSGNGSMLQANQQVLVGSL